MNVSIVDEGEKDDTPPKNRQTNKAKKKTKRA
jgi:hypothetical protein